MLNESAIVTLITGAIGIAIILVSKLKCVIDEEGHIKSGCTDNPIIDNHDVEVSTVRINDVDFLYVRHNQVDFTSERHVNESDSE